jgi:hypothetical protein
LRALDLLDSTTVQTFTRIEVGIWHRKVKILFFLK